LSLLRQDVVEIDVLLEVRVLHGPAPELFFRGRKLAGAITGFVDRTEDVEQIREAVQDSAGVEIAESEHAAIRTAGVVWKDGFQRGMSLGGGAPLFSGKSGDADHS